jgi:hypothetical protein
LRRILKPNKINHFGMSADYSVLPHENCKTVYTSSILVVASIKINELARSDRRLTFSCNHARIGDAYAW